MTRLAKTEEVIELAIMFQNSYCGLCIDDIQEHFECSRRSAVRMKDLLFDLFADKIEEVPTNDKKKYWRFAKGAVNSLVAFSADDFANLEYLKGLSNDENKKKQLNDTISKIKALTPQKKLRSLDTDISAIMESEGFAVRQYSRVKTDVKYLEKIRNALLAFKKISFIYPVKDEFKEIILNPYGVIISDKYYVVGFNEHVNSLRLYRVDRMQTLEILEEYFEKDETFSLQEYCNNSFSIYQETPLDIILEFNQLVAEDVLNYHFHPTQKIKKLANGNIQVEFTSGGTHAICYELFKWGKHVKIKQPTELKKYYKSYLKEVFDNQ